ncbi:MAG: ribbon-helix-helix protein, CopG family [Deltaproteobacteria bacterium]|nr:ribbon-helix-helix protein, CopG family [Deltaproteobacteria bacterium]
MGDRRSARKVKVTASLDAGLIKAVDEFIDGSKALSRSQVIEDILRKWHEEQKRQDLERQIEGYYLSLSDEEKEEDRQWNEITVQSAHDLWEE